MRELTLYLIVTPRGIVYLGKTTRRSGVPSDEPEAHLLQEETQHEESVNDTQIIVGLQRLGLWGISGQLINTVSYPIQLPLPPPSHFTY